MGGGVRLPCVITRDTIRREGERLGCAGDDLADFIEIIAGIDDSYLEIETKRIAADVKASAARSKKR